MKKKYGMFAFENDAEKKEFENCLASGKTKRMIAKKFGCNETSVYNIAKRNGMNPKQLREQFRQRIRDKAIDMYCDGYLKKEILKECDISEKTLDKIIESEDYYVKAKAKEERELAKDLKGKKYRNPIGYSWVPKRFEDPEREITDLGKLKALNNAGWSIEKIADEFGVTIEEVNRCLEMLNSK